MAKYREVPCRYYIAYGEYKKARGAAAKLTVSIVGNMSKGQGPETNISRGIYNICRLHWMAIYSISALLGIFQSLPSL